MERARSAFVILKPIQRKQETSLLLPSHKHGRKTNRAKARMLARLVLSKIRLKMCSSGLASPARNCTKQLPVCSELPPVSLQAAAQLHRLG